MALRLPLRAPALGWVVQPARAASTCSSSSNTSTNGGERTGTASSPRRYHITVDSVTWLSRPRLRWPSALYWDPLPLPNTFSLLSGPSLLSGWPWSLSRPARALLLERLVLSGALAPQPAERGFSHATSEGAAAASGHGGHEKDGEKTQATGEARTDRVHQQKAASEAKHPENTAKDATGSSSSDAGQAPSPSPSSSSGDVADSRTDSRVADSDSNVFRMETDVSGFSEDEVKVTVSNGSVTLEASRDSHTDGGHFSRRLYRSVTLPTGVDEARVTVTRTAEGTVVVEAPLEQ